jgi:beta-lactamase superfamily II metal-dependent hydrolase
MEQLRVRLYNVLFGDAILVSVPDRDAVGVTHLRHILIDVGNVLGGEGGLDEVFKPVIDDVVAELDGKPLDLYVMTHEHLDHVQGLFHVATKTYPDGELQEKLKIEYAWITASAAEDYYDRFPDAEKKHLQLLDTYHRIETFLRASAERVAEPFRTLLLNNNPSSTSQCVAFLRELADTTTYIHRESDLTGTHPFEEAKLEVWAPEEDTSEYYGRFRPLYLGVSPGASGGPSHATLPLPPAGVDAGAFYNLIDLRRRGIADNLLAIDKAANNSSIVFSLEWRGWTLLFSGDAELRSWKTMNREGVLRAVDFLKVAHHGSHNGTPSGEIFDVMLPKDPANPRERWAAISTCRDTYSGIPHDETDTRLKKRCTLITTLDDPNEPWVELVFEGD